MQTDAIAPPPTGRPRDSRADRAILEATLELIGELGIHEFRIEDVAARAGVGKGAIYRRYRSKDELITAAIAALDDIWRKEVWPAFTAHFGIA